MTTENYDFTKDILPKDESLQTISILVKRALAQKDTVLELEEALSEAKKQLRETEEKTLPDALIAVGYNVDSVIKVDGVKVSLKTDIQMSVSNENSKYRIPVLDWLRQTNNDQIIKNQFQIEIPKNFDKDLTEIKEQLQELGLSYVQYESFNTTSAKAIIRTEILNDVDVPCADLGVRVVQKAIIKL